MKKVLFMFMVFLAFSRGYAIPQYYCTASDEAHYQYLLNLIGSIQGTNFDELNTIAVYDLGLTKDQLAYLNKIDKVKVCKIQDPNPALLTYFTIPTGEKCLGWYAWKPVAIKESLETFPYLLWLDPTTTVLKPLDNLFRYIKENGYFVMTIGSEKVNDQFKNSVKGQTTAFVFDYFNLNDPKNEEVLSKDAITGIIVGTSRRANLAFSQDWYDLTKDSRFFADDGTAPGGYGRARHDQSVLTLLVYLKNLKVMQQDYKQKTPMMLNLKRENIPFYITWNQNFCDNRTSILISPNLKNLSANLNKIKFK